MMVATTVWPSMELGNFEPDRSLFGKVVEVVRLIRSHKTIKVASSNSAYRESSQRPVLRGNTNRVNGRKPAWGYAC